MTLTFDGESVGGTRTVPWDRSAERFSFHHDRQTALLYNLTTHIFTLGVIYFWKYGDRKKVQTQISHHHLCRSFLHHDSHHDTNVQEDMI